MHLSSWSLINQFSLPFSSPYHMNSGLSARLSQRVGIQPWCIIRAARPSAIRNVSLLFIIDKDSFHFLTHACLFASLHVFLQACTSFFRHACLFFPSTASGRIPKRPTSSGTRAARQRQVHPARIDKYKANERVPMQTSPRHLHGSLAIYANVHSWIDCRNNDGVLIIPRIEDFHSERRQRCGCMRVTINYRAQDWDPHQFPLCLQLLGPGR